MGACSWLPAPCLTSSASPSTCSCPLASPTAILRPSVDQASLVSAHLLVNEEEASASPAVPAGADGLAEEEAARGEHLATGD